MVSRCAGLSRRASNRSRSPGPNSRIDYLRWAGETPASGRLLHLSPTKPGYRAAEDQRRTPPNSLPRISSSVCGGGAFRCVCWAGAGTDCQGVPLYLIALASMQQRPQRQITSYKITMGIFLNSGGSVSAQVFSPTLVFNQHVIDP